MAMIQEPAPELGKDEGSKRNKLQEAADKAFQKTLKRFQTGKLTRGGKKVRDFEEAMEMAMGRAQRIFPDYNPQNAN